MVIIITSILLIIVIILSVLIMYELKVGGYHSILTTSTISTTSVVFTQELLIPVQSIRSIELDVLIPDLEINRLSEQQPQPTTSFSVWIIVLVIVLVIFLIAIWVYRTYTRQPIIGDVSNEYIRARDTNGQLEVIIVTRDRDEMFNDWINFMNSKPIWIGYEESKCSDEKNSKQIIKDKSRIKLDKESDQRVFVDAMIPWYNYKKEHRPCYSQTHGYIISLLIRYIHKDPDFKRITDTWAYLLPSHLWGIDDEDYREYPKRVVNYIIGKPLDNNELYDYVNKVDVGIVDAILGIYVSLFGNRFGLYVLDFMMSAPVGILYYLISAYIIETEKHEWGIKRSDIIKTLDQDKQYIFNICKLACNLWNDKPYNKLDEQ